MPYDHILIAVDLSPEARQLCERGQEQAAAGQPRISLMHVVEPILALPPYELPSAYPEGLEESMVEHAEQRLQDLAREFSLSEWDLHVGIGATKSVILEYAETKQVDLIIVGSHGRHGVKALLGSTANAIIHHAACDVLAVRISD